MDPSKFDLEKDAQKEVQKFIKNTISMFNKCDKNNLSFEKIYVIGGLDNELYKKFNSELNRMKENYSTILSVIDELNVDVLRNFLKTIEYSNVLMNINEHDLDEARGSAFISDLTIVIDRTTTPPTFFMTQYYGTENELCGGMRNIKPQLMFTYNFDLKCWNIIDYRSSSFQSSHADEMLNKFNHNFVSTDNLQKTIDQIMNYLKIIKH
ncbi:unnamed protein product [Rotaria sp. Silwood1]|nr:unnamed protein product [Rotaria sp. Silwood1]CAF1671463.1 unnamed protein product [Rotaria sp. Silwood1]CAF3792139.1 unnamed protein product [Rotaria sp. Silwood1]CAF3796818.1 unnamed protein product [Rotaria sp. Silwood1]CAF3860916.1 unnamed protein product [Rotaria sp. Silwood1]